MRDGHEYVVVLSDLFNFTLPFFELGFVGERNYYFNDTLIVISGKTNHLQIGKFRMFDTQLLLCSLGKRLLGLGICRTHLANYISNINKNN